MVLHGQIFLWMCYAVFKLLGKGKTQRCTRVFVLFVAEVMGARKYELFREYNSVFFTNLRGKFKDKKIACRNMYAKKNKIIKNKACEKEKGAEEFLYGIPLLWENYGKL